MRHSLHLVWAFLVLCVAIPAMAGEPLFRDSFENLANWTKASGSDPKLGQLKSGETLTPCLLMGNGVIKANLPRAIENSFVLSFRAINSNFQRGLWMGVFNAEGTKGYAAFWDSSVENAFQGQGNVAISRFDLAKKVAWADQVGKVLTTRIASGQKAVGEWPAMFELEWHKPSHTFTLRINGVEKAKVADSSFNTFAAIYIRGNERSIFTDIRLAEFKPASREAR